MLQGSSSSLADGAIEGRAAGLHDALEKLSATIVAESDWAAGVEARGRALTSDDDTAEHWYLESIACLARTPLRPDLARSRLVYGESDGFPSLVADRYDDVLVVQTLSQGAERLRDVWVGELADRLGVRGVLARNDARPLAGVRVVNPEQVFGQVPAETPMKVDDAFGTDRLVY